jgi:hypothetical protein
MQSWRRSWDKKLTGVFTAWAEDSDQVISPTFKNDHMRIPQKPTSIKAAMARSIWKVPLQCRSQPVVLKQWSYALYYITKTSRNVRSLLQKKQNEHTCIWRKSHRQQEYKYQFLRHANFATQRAKAVVPLSCWVPCWVRLQQQLSHLECSIKSKSKSRRSLV